MPLAPREFRTSQRNAWGLDGWPPLFAAPVGVA